MSDNIPLLKQCTAALLLAQEADLEFGIDCLISDFVHTRKSCSQLFKDRDEEGAYNILVKRHLMTDDLKFKEFFRLKREQFSKIADLIREDVTLQPTHRVKETLSAEMKLAVTLRYV